MEDVMFSSSKPSIEEIINNMKLNQLYKHEFENGKRFFYLVNEDQTEDPTTLVFRISHRIYFSVTFLQKEKDIEGIRIVKLERKNGSEEVKQEITLSKFNFQQLRSFLQFINEIDLGLISDRRTPLLSIDLLSDEDVKKALHTLLLGKNSDEILIKILNDGLITSKDIVNIAYRKNELNTFNSLLMDKDCWKQYAREKKIPDGNKEEKVWQYFFKKNEWIFGYGLDYRFNSIIQDEFYLSNTEGDGSQSVITDFLLADNRFTTFVEIKKPSTPLFVGNSTDRSRTWKLSSDLTSAYSQILQQKSSGLIKLNKGELHTREGKKINQKAIDSKVILIIGSWKEIEADNDLCKTIKEKTFELFRKDSRNVEIITYDELYERARFITECNERNS